MTDIKDLHFSYRKFVEPVRDIILSAKRRESLGDCSPYDEVANFILKTLSSDSVELAMHKAKERGATMKDCLIAALATAFDDRNP